MNKSRLSDFDSYSIYYPTVTTGTCTIGLTSMAFTYWSQSLLMWDFTTYFPYFKSYPSQCNRVYLVFRLLSNRHSPDLHIWNISMTSTLSWPSSRWSDFTSYFAYITCTSFPFRTCIVGFASNALMLWWTKSRLCEFDWHFPYYPKIWPGPAPSDSPSSLLWDFTTYFPYFKSNPSQTSIIGLVSKAYTLWWTKWFLKYFDSKCAFYATGIGYYHHYVLI